MVRSTTGSERDRHPGCRNESFDRLPHASRSLRRNHWSRRRLVRPRPCIRHWAASLDPVPHSDDNKAQSAGLVDAENPGVELINLTEPVANMMQAVVADRDGSPIWYYDVGSDQANLPSPIKLIPNGHLVVNIQSGATGATCLREIDLAGQTIRQMDAPTLQQKLQDTGVVLDELDFHHDFLSLSNGHLVLLASVIKDFVDLPGYPGTTQVTGDVLVDLDQGWNPVWFWSAFDHLDVNRHLMGLPDWTHSNAVVYTPDDGNLLISMRNQSWILKIDYRNGSGSGDVLWRLGKDGDFTLNGGDPSQWFYAQHFPSLLNTDGLAINHGNF